MTGTIVASFIAALLQTQPVMQLPQSSGDDYTISKQDVLNVIVIDQPQLSKKYSVDADGGIAFPLLGHVIVAGKTLREVEAELKRRNLNPRLDTELSFNCVDINGFKTQVCDRQLVVLAEKRPPSGGE